MIVGVFGAGQPLAGNNGADLEYTSAQNANAASILTWFEKDRTVSAVAGAIADVAANKIIVKVRKAIEDFLDGINYLRECFGKAEDSVLKTFLSPTKKFYAWDASNDRWAAGADFKNMSNFEKVLADFKQGKADEKIRKCFEALEKNVSAYYGGGAKTDAYDTWFEKYFDFKQITTVPDSFLAKKFDVVNYTENAFNIISLNPLGSVWKVAGSTDLGKYVIGKKNRANNDTTDFNKAGVFEYNSVGSTFKTAYNYIQDAIAAQGLPDFTDPSANNPFFQAVDYFAQEKLPGVKSMAGLQTVFNDNKNKEVEVFYKDAANGVAGSAKIKVLQYYDGSALADKVQAGLTDNLSINNPNTDVSDKLSDDVIGVKRERHSRLNSFSSEKLKENITQIERAAADLVAQKNKKTASKKAQKEREKAARIKLKKGIKAIKREVNRLSADGELMWRRIEGLTYFMNEILAGRYGGMVTLPAGSADEGQTKKDSEIFEPIPTDIFESAD